MAKTAAHKIADHLGWDIADVREHRYQHAAFSAPVFAMGGDYYSAGCKPPKYLRGVDDLKWQRIVSAYDGMTSLWHAKVTLIAGRR